MDSDPHADGLEPLKIKCTSSMCENGLHCFRVTRKLLAENKAGHCRTCGIALVDWKRVHSRDLEDVAYTFTALKLELIRHHFWHTPIDDAAMAHGRRKGTLGIRAAVERRIRKYLAPSNPPFDGRQTPKQGNVVYYAQHATASCCRTCLHEWHDIAKGHELSNDEVMYLVELAMLYIEDRIPSLTREGERIPARRGRFQQNAVTS